MTDPAAMSETIDEVQRRFFVYKERAERAEEFARFVATLDDPRAIELRRSITLTKIIDRAKDVLAEAKP